MQSPLGRGVMVGSRSLARAIRLAARFPQIHHVWIIADQLNRHGFHKNEFDDMIWIPLTLRILRRSRGTVVRPRQAFCSQSKMHGYEGREWPRYTRTLANTLLRFRFWSTEGQSLVTSSLLFLLVVVASWSYWLGN